MSKISRAATAALLACFTTASGQDLVVFPGQWAGGTCADIDGDGLADRLTSDGVHLGIGNGLFGDAIPVAGFGGLILQAGEMTGDGLIDLFALTNDTSSQPPHSHFEIAVGLGGASFGPLIETPTSVGAGLSGYSQRHEVADVDGDGLDDIVVVTAVAPIFSGFEFTIARSLGNGLFEETASLPAPWLDIGVGDFDGDGLLDVASVDSEGTLIVHVGTGSGHVDPVSVNSLIVASEFVFGASITATDLDLDGISDIVAAGYGGGGIVVTMHGIGDGHLVPASIVPVLSPCVPSIGDLDADGWNDVVLAVNPGFGTGALSPGISTCLNDGLGGLLPEVITDMNEFPVYDNGSGLVVRDLDGDDIADVGLYFILSGLGDGTFVHRTQLHTEEEQAQLAAAADMDADGTVDVVGTLGSPDRAVAVMLGHGDGTFDALVRPAIPDYAYELAVGDFDADGLPDLVLDQGFSTGPLTVVLNAGSGVDFSAPVVLAPFDVSDIAVGDVDANGSLDVAVARPTQAGAWVILSDGTGHFAPAEHIDLSGKAIDVALADLDGQGTLDIVTVVTGAKQLQLALGVGGGSFGPAQSLPLSEKANHVSVADLNADGLADLATANAGAAGASVLLATGPAVFNAPQDIETINYPTELAVADLDRDGRLDLITIGSGVLGFLHGHGDGTFADAQLYDSGSQSKNLALGDFDTDGFLDLAVGNGVERVFSVLINRLTTFSNLGYQHDAGFGFPHLTGTGTPAPGELVSLTVTGVPAPALGFLIIGTHFAPQLFAGGTLVPSPDVAVPMHPDVALTGRWPELPAGVQLYLQAWFTHGGEVAASNTVISIGP